MIPPDIRRRFDAIAQPLNIIQSKVRDIVLDFCDRNQYAYIGRSKSLESLAEKIETGRFSAWSDIDDLFGCTIVVPSHSHEKAALEYLRSEFREHVTKMRGQTNQDPEVFRFGATRFIGTLRPSPVPDSDLSNLRFEIQIRTAFEHAWSVAVHHLSYKANTIDWKFERLAAQLKATVEQLDVLVAIYEQAANTLLEHPWPATQMQQKILVYFKGLVETGKIPRDNQPSSWGRFAKNVHSLVASCTPQGAIAAMKREDRIDPLLDALTQEINTNSFPRTLSLFQFAIGTFVERGLIGVKFKENYFPLVTNDLEELFPKTAEIDSRFNFDK